MASKKKKEVKEVVAEVAPVEKEVLKDATLSLIEIQEDGSHKVLAVSKTIEVEVDRFEVKDHQEEFYKEPDNVVFLKQKEDGSIEVKEAPKVEVIFEKSKMMPDRFIDTIICHCDASDSEYYDEIEEVREDHIENRGFSDIGYHYYIEADGSVEAGRSLNTVGAHAKGHNANSIGICVHGNTMFTAASLQSLENKIRELIAAIPTITKVIGHNEVDKNKTCPNYHMKRFKSILNEF